MDNFLNSNPEFQFSVTQLTKAMHAVHKAYGHVCDSWQQRKLQLDQGIQLRMFEADCQKVKKTVLLVFYDFWNSTR